MLQLVGFRKRGMSYRYIISVECQKIHKKSKKFPVTFDLLISWSDGQKTVIERPYIAVFDFMNVLKKTYPDCQIPELKDAKWFESLWKARKEEKKKVLEEFFQKILNLPETVAHGKEVIEFFEFLWHRDSGASEPPLNSAEGSGPRAHSTAVIGPVESDYESIDIEGAGYSKLSIKPKSISVFKRQSSDDANSTYWAVTEYSKRKSGEVDLTVGAAVSVLQRELSGWWFVHVEETNEQGWAPAACLLPDDRSSLLDSKITGPFGEFRALRDFEGVEPDEISCKKGEKVEIIEASLDGWWEVRCRDRVGIIPATNLEPASNQAMLRSSLYHQVGIYKKDSPPPRRNSKIPVEELYCKVDKFRKNTVQPNSATALPHKNAKDEPSKILLLEPKSIEKPEADDEANDDNPHFYANDSYTSAKHSYVNVELNPKRNTSNGIKYYKTVKKHGTNGENQERPVLVVGTGDIVECHVEETDEIFGKLFRLADGSFPEPKEGWLPKLCLELYILAPDDVVIKNVPNSTQRLSNSVVQRPTPPKRIYNDKPVAAQSPSKSPSQPPLNPRSGTSQPSVIPESQSTVDLNENSKSHAVKKTEKVRDPSSPQAKAVVVSETSVARHPTNSHLKAAAPSQCKVHRFSRTECENILLESATHCQYVIRESTKAGHFALSVRSVNRIHHFPIELTAERKYFIGQYHFDSLDEVISYYSENPLFESDDGIGVMLGTSLECF